MKTLITILLTAISILSCKGQDADTLIYFTEEDMIEKQEIIDSLELRIEVLQSLVEVKYDGKSVTADTFNFEIVDKRIKVELNKQGHNVWVNIIDGTTRINSDYVNYKKIIRIMNDASQIGYLYLDSENNEGTVSIKRE